jgi:hypothetical protein
LKEKRTVRIEELTELLRTKYAYLLDLKIE